ncbi:MFS transporter [Paenibacillus allorhizosphaerae]|uniref:Transporter n=1 Tax=Paenibacillus allorhizosphaerae TaxID=2849866 RepID=A0ABM8VIL5_9BACL|nr:MFS transporter [Paenibacillus allorhizosphaerae]CAG7644303.1 putative transporter [Paenibacillus allorhizosphaerae]
MAREQQRQGASLTKGLVFLMAVSCGLAVANLYYNQPLLAEIGRTFQASDQMTGMISMLTQIGYAVGMFLFIPLGDIKERRGMIVLLLLAVGVALVGVAAAQNLIWMYAASMAVGITTVAPQMIVPLAAHLAAPEERGKVIGNVMSGLLIGILLARTVSGLIGGMFGWRSMYVIAAVLMFALAYTLRRKLPASYPEMQLSYGQLVRSMGSLIAGERTLREAAMIGAMMFGAFSVFWTALTFYLEGPHYGYGSEVAGLFGLVGVAGAAAASVIGRLTDRWSPRLIAGIAVIIALLSYASFWLVGSVLWGMIIGVILLDLGVQGVQITNQARIYRLQPEARSRINTVFMVSCFVGGAVGSSMGSYAWSRWAWDGVCAVGGSMVLLAFVFWLSFRAGTRGEKG